MATTKIWPIKDSLRRVTEYASNPEKTEYDDLKASIGYAVNGEKTGFGDEKVYLTTGIRCDADTAFEEMMAVKESFGKTGGNVAYHAYQSFKPGEVTPQMCHQIGVELAEKLWGDRYQVLVATHLDKEHLHNHFIVNSVSFVDGKKFNDNKAAYRKLRQTSDELCREHELSVIERPGGRTPRQIYFAEKNGEATRYNLMREAIDKAISLSTNFPTFINLMKQQGYIISYSYSRKYPTIRSVNSQKAVRLYRLGEDYELDRIVQRVNANDYKIVAVNRGTAVIPTAESSSFTDQLSELSRKLNEIDYAGISKDVRKTLQGIDKLLATLDSKSSELDVSGLSENLEKTLKELDKTLSTLRGGADGVPGLLDTLEQVLTELDKTVKEVRPGLKRTSRDPSLVIFGGSGADPIPAGEQHE